MVTDEGIKSINLYDIFANIVPGLSFIFGLLIPLKPIPTIKLLFGADTSIKFGIGQLLLLIAIAFIIGQLLQAFGSRYDGDHGFDTFVRHLRGDNVDTRYEITEFDQSFWKFCKKEFYLSDDFQAHGRLFKAVLSFLETSERNRALRMQALYLFSRGVFVAAIFLGLLYAAIAISMQYSYLPPELMPYFRRPRTIVLGIIATVVLAYVTNKEREEFETDWVEYTLTEFYLELVEKHHENQSEKCPEDPDKEQQETPSEEHCGNPSESGNPK